MCVKECVCVCFYYQGAGIPNPCAWINNGLHCWLLVVLPGCEGCESDRKLGGGEIKWSAAIQLLFNIIYMPHALWE